MTKNLKFFLIPFVLSIPLWWGINIWEANLQNFFFQRELAQNPQILAAQANQLAFAENLRNLKPIRDSSAEDLIIEAKSVISVFLSDQGSERILFEKNSNQKLPIASLTKLMTAKVVLENYDLSKEIRISKEAVSQEENLGKLQVGSFLQVEYLLYPLLMESSNDAAFALANDYDGMTEEEFIRLMNAQAQKSGLKNTYFVNVTGLDPEEEEEDKSINYSSAGDLVIFAKELLKTPLIWEILATPQINLYGAELINGNKLLGEIPRIIGGKTGNTDEALECFLLVLEAPKSKGCLINVILGSESRFSEMEKLVDWIHQSYNW